MAGTLRGTKQPSPQARKPRLTVEFLEHRLAPAQLSVTSALDPATLTPGTLRFEVQQANVDARYGVSDTIVFNVAQMGTKTITLTQGQLELTAGSGATTINGGGQVTVSGNYASRVFEIDSGTVTISGITITGGSSPSGGGVLNFATLTLYQDVLTGNHETPGGDGGGAILSFGSGSSLTINQCTISNNSASWTGGGVSLIDATSTVTAGTGFSVTITATNQDGSGYNGFVTLSCNDSQSMAPQTVNLVNGSATVTVTLARAETVTLTAASGSVSGTSGNITVTSAAVASLNISAPSSVTAGYSFNVTITGTVSLSSSDPQAGAPITYTFTSADQGSHTFDVTQDTAGSQTLTATDATESNVTGQAIVEVTPSVAASLALFAPAQTTIGSPTPFFVTALDNWGNVATGFSDFVTTTSSDPKAILPSGYFFSAGDAGSHEFLVTFKSTGNRTFAVQDSYNYFLSGRLQLAVSAAPAKLVIKSQPPTSVTAGAAFGPIVVDAVDSHGNPLTAFNGLVTLTLAGNPFGGATLSGTVTAQAFRGVAIFTGVIVSTPGTGYRLQASSGSVNVTNTTYFSVAAVASQLVVINQPPSTVTAGSSFGLTVAVEDAYGNVATGYYGTVTLTLPSSLGGGILASAYAYGGEAYFTGLTLNQVGSGYTLTASTGSFAPVTTSAITVTPAPSQLAISSPPPGSVVAGSGFGLSVTAEDAQGNVLTSFNGSVTLTLANNPDGSTLGGPVTVQAVNGVATFYGLTLYQAGSGYTLTASAGAVSATTTGITVTPGAATHLAVFSQPYSVYAGVAFSLVIEAEDAYGNLVTTYNGNMTLSMASNPAHGTLGGKLTATMVNGMASFSGLTLSKVGNGYVMKAAGGSLAAASTAPISVTARPR